MFSRTFIFLDDDRRDRIKVGLYECLKSLPADKKFRITVEDYKEDKTAEQRNWFHTLCGILGNELGNTKGQMKEIIKKELMGTEIVMVGNVKHEITRSSEELGRQEYSQLIETCYRVGADMGIILPSARWAA